MTNMDQKTAQQMPSIGRTVWYVNLGDKDGKYPPECQAAIITGIYQRSTVEPMDTAPSPGNNKPEEMKVVPCNTVGQRADATFVDLRVMYRDGEFNMKCVPFSAEPSRGHWCWPPRV